MTAPQLTARKVSAVLRAAGITGTRCSTEAQSPTTGETWSVGVTIAAAIGDPAIGRAARAALMQAGYEVTGSSNLVCLTVVLPEPVEETVEEESAEPVDELLDRVAAEPAVARRLARAEEPARHEEAATRRAVAEEQDGTDGLVHLMSDDLLDACGTAGPGGLHLAPSTTPERITCPRCLVLAVEEEVEPATVERYRAPSGNRDEDRFRAVHSACGWRSLAWHSNRTVEGRRIAEREAQQHRCAEPIVDDDPREEPARVEWSEFARS